MFAATEQAVANPPASPIAQGQLAVLDVREVSDIPDEQAAQVIAQMTHYANRDAKSPEVLADAQEILRQAGTDDQATLAAATWRYVADRVTFERDRVIALPYEQQFKWHWPVVEVLIPPRDMSQLCSSGNCRRQGDCDDFSMWVASILGALKIQRSFVTVAADPEEPGMYSHVYVAAYPKQAANKETRIPLDASHGSYAGWEVPNRFNKLKEWPLEHSAFYGYLLAAAALTLGIWAVIGAGK